MTRRIRRGKQFVYLREDFKDLGGSSQVGRVLRQLVQERLLARISQGVYVELRPSTLDPEKRTLVASFNEICCITLNRLGIKWRPGDAVIAYNLDLSTEIPVHACVVVDKPITRRIQYKTMFLRWEVGDLERLDGGIFAGPRRSQ
jgi:hypothetical protein